MVCFLHFFKMFFMATETNLILNKELECGFFIKSFEVKKNIELTFPMIAIRQEAYNIKEESSCIFL